MARFFSKGQTAVISSEEDVMEMLTKQTVESCWYCGDLATDMVGVRHVCPYCKTKLENEMKRRMMEAICGVVFFGILILSFWLVMEITDKNWIPIH